MSAITGDMVFTLSFMQIDKLFIRILRRKQNLSTCHFLGEEQ
jgi:hypothetical protein